MGWGEKRRSTPPNACGGSFWDPVRRMPEATALHKGGPWDAEVCIPGRTSFLTASAQALKGPGKERRGLRRSRVTWRTGQPAPSCSALGALVRKREGRRAPGRRGETMTGEERMAGVTPDRF